MIFLYRTEMGRQTKPATSFFPPELSVSSKIHSSPLSKDTLCIYCGFNLTLPLFTSALAFPHGRENLFFSLGQGSKLSQGNFVLTRLDFGESNWRTVEGVKIARLQIRIQPPAWGKITLSRKVWVKAIAPGLVQETPCTEGQRRDYL